MYLQLCKCICIFFFLFAVAEANILAGLLSVHDFYYFCLKICIRVVVADVAVVVASLWLSGQRQRDSAAVKVKVVACIYTLCICIYIDICKVFKRTQQLQSDCQSLLLLSKWLLLLLSPWGFNFNVFCFGFLLLFHSISFLLSLSLFSWFALLVG